MTFLSEATMAERTAAVINDVVLSEDEILNEPVMAIVDEFGVETPITELDIRRSLKQLADEAAAKQHSDQDDFDSLMLLADAARAIA